MCGFSLATNRSRPGADGTRQEETAFHRVIAWGQLAEQCAKLLKRGSCVFVAGRLSYRTYTRDDVQRDVTEIVIDDMLLLDKRNSEGKDSGERPVAAHATPTTAEHIYSADEIAEEVPF